MQHGDDDTAAQVRQAQAQVAATVAAAAPAHYRVAEVAALLAVSKSTIYRAIAAGDLRALRVGQVRAMRVSHEDFDAYRASLATTPEEPAA
jgi:excisionase family DNA binding protein